MALGHCSFAFWGEAQGRIACICVPWVSLGMEYRAEAWGGGPTTGSLRSLGPPPHPLPLGINKVGSRAYLRSRVSIGVQQGGIMLPVAELSRRRRSGRPSRMARLTGFSCPFEVSDPLPFAHMFMS